MIRLDGLAEAVNAANFAQNLKFCDVCCITVLDERPKYAVFLAFDCSLITRTELLTEINDFLGLYRGGD